MDAGIWYLTFRHGNNGRPGKKYLAEYKEDLTGKARSILSQSQPDDLTKT